MSKNHEQLQARMLAVVPPSTSATTGITINSVGGTSVGLTYTGLNGNNPGTYGNFISIFQSTSQDFPFGTTNKPVATASITGNNSGSIIIPANILINTSYVVGYSVGPLGTVAGIQPYGNVCASAFIPATGSTFPSVSPNLILNDVEANSISINYNVPNGLTPGSNGAWAGLWVGNNPSYTLTPTSYAQITSNAAVGGPLIFNNVQINRGTLFSVALFMTGWISGGVGSTQTAMACTLQFTT